MAGAKQRGSLGKGAIDFRILGPLEVWDGRRIVPLHRRKLRCLLALLVLHAGELIPADVLVDQLWGADSPRTALDSLRNYVSLVRRELGPDVVQTRDQGYMLSADPHQIDLLRFERLIKDSRAASSTEDRAATLRKALAIWRGAPLSDLAYEPFVLRETPRLEELRLVAREDLITAELELGHSGELVPQLEALVAAHPFHERFHAQLMLALYRSGRQAEALEVYRRARDVLVERLGICPGPDLRQLERAILRQAPELDWGAGASDLVLRGADPGRRAHHSRLAHDPRALRRERRRRGSQVSASSAAWICFGGRRGRG